MTAPRDLDTILAAWLDEGPTDLPDVTRRAIAGALPTTNQARRGPFAPWRFLDMNAPLRLAALAAALVIATAGAIYLVGPRFGIGGPGPTPTAAPTPSPTPQLGVSLGTVTLTATGCTWVGNPGRITGAEPLVGSIMLVNETDTFANYGIFRLADGRTWEEGQSWIADMNEEFHGGPAASVPAGEFTTQVGTIDAPERGRYPNTLTLRAGTHGIVCSSNEPPPGLIFAVYLAGPLEVAAN
jgi:hypothetical protein